MKYNQRDPLSTLKYYPTDRGGRKAREEDDKTPLSEAT